VRQQATTIVAVHNHPSGDPTSSAADVALTVEIVAAGQLLDIELLDHLIIGQGRWLSLKRQGLGFARRSHPPIRSLGAEQEAAEKRAVARDDPVPELHEPDEWAASRQTNHARMPSDFRQGEEDRSPSGELTTVGRNHLHCLAGSLAQRGSHGRTWTLLEGNDLEPLLVVMPPEPGGSPSSEVSPTVPDEPVLSHRR